MSNSSIPKMPTLILYGGSFDPPHQGHIDSAQAAAKRFPNALVIVAPAPEPAGIAGVHKKPTASFEHRINMCQVAFQNLAKKATLEVSDIETRLSQPNFTLNTLKAIAKSNPGNRLFLLIGQDQLRGFDCWQKPKTILSMCNLIVATRNDQHKSLDNDIKQLAERLGVDAKRNEQDGSFIFSQLDSTIVPLYDRICPAESTAIRDALRRHEDIPPAWLPPELAEYISEHGLYQ